MTGEPSGAYGASNSFPKQASNTKDWLEAIGLVRSAAHPRPGASPIVAHESNSIRHGTRSAPKAWCRVESGYRLYFPAPAEPLQGSTGGPKSERHREIDRQREKGESTNGRPTQASGGVPERDTRAPPVLTAHGSRVCVLCAGAGSAGTRSIHGGQAADAAGQVQLDLLALHQLDHHQAVGRGDDLLRISRTPR